MRREFLMHLRPSGLIVPGAPPPAEVEDKKKPKPKKPKPKPIYRGIILPDQEMLNVRRDPEGR